MKNVFELVSNGTDDLVVLKVNADDNLTIAMHPYISSLYDYITVTKGTNHILTVVKKDGTTFSFYWGTSGYTCISESLEMLRTKVVEFIQKCGIMLGIRDNVVVREMGVFYNDNFNAYEFTMQPVKGDADYYYSKTAHSLDDMLAEVYAMGLVKVPINEWDEVMNQFVGREYKWVKKEIR